MKRTFLMLALIFAAGSTAFAAPPVTIAFSGDLLMTHPYTPGEDIYSESPAEQWTIDVAMRLFELKRFGVMLAGGYTQTRRSFETDEGWYTWTGWTPFDNIKWDETRMRVGLRGRYELWKGSVSAGGGIMESSREYNASSFPPSNYDSDQGSGVIAPYLEAGLSFKVARYFELFARHEWFFSGPLDVHRVVYQSYTDSGVLAGTIPETSNASEVRSLNIGIRLLLP